MNISISSFKFLSDKNPILVTLLVVYQWIICRWNDVYKFTTLSRDARAAGNDDEAKRLKGRTGAIVPAGVFVGGHQIANLERLTQICMADFDHITHELMPTIINKVKADAHTVLEYITNSQMGVRILFQWIAIDENGEVIPPEYFAWNRDSESHDEFLCRVLPYHAAAYSAGNAYFAELLGIPFDSQTKDVSRLSFLAHDPNAFFCADAEPFVVSAEDVKMHSDAYNEVKSPCSIQTEYDRINRSNYLDQHADNVFDLIELWVSRDTIYATGSYNKYVSHCGYLCCEFGIDEDIAIAWAVIRFSDYNSRQVTSIIRSCYRKARFGIRSFINYNQNDTK